MLLGEKIRSLRKARGMTQARLAGDRITRNMLCEIEKGKATPSLDTLRYLAEALSVPVPFLLDEGEDATGYYKREALPEIRRLYLAGRYAECFHLCESLPGEPDDELALILSHCALAEGKRAFHSGNMETALVYFGEAISFSKQTVYPTEGLRASALLYSALSENVASPRRDFDENAYLSLATLATERELYAYMTDDTAFPYENSLYATHIEARRLIRNRRHREALPLLISLEEKKGLPEVSAYFLFRLYSDMELCYREDAHFEMAYRYAAKRMNLLSAFQS
ncbi:MAG: helix-turn-helix transcriptional regulator [Clostridia bacterium]|nr:helix-turn-helix transcriptional regulator [Clostridia bacterium]